MELFVQSNPDRVRLGSPLGLGGNSAADRGPQKQLAPQATKPDYDPSSSHLRASERQRTTTSIGLRRAKHWRTKCSACFAVEPLVCVCVCMQGKGAGSGAPSKELRESLTMGYCRMRWHTAEVTGSPKAGQYFGRSRSLARPGSIRRGSLRCQVRCEGARNKRK